MSCHKKALHKCPVFNFNFFNFTRSRLLRCLCARHFPALLKEHKSHDVLLMCVTCHQRSNLHDNELKRHLLAECRPDGASLLDGHDKYVHDPLLTRVKSAAKCVNTAAVIEFFCRLSLKKKIGDTNYKDSVDSIVDENNQK